MLKELEDDIKLSDVIDVDFLQNFQDTFAQSTGMASIIVDSEGPITKPSNFTDFCIKYTRESKEGFKKCNECDLMGGKISAATGEPYVYYCHSGLMDFAAPIIVNGKLIGSVLGGQVLPQAPDIEKFRQKAMELGVDEEKYLKALEDIKVVPQEQIEAAAKILFIVANAISEISYRNWEISKNSKKINAILSGMIDGVVTVDENNSIKYCNSAITEVYNFAEDELISRHLSVLLPELKQSDLDDVLNNNSYTGSTYLRKKCGTRIPVEIKASQIIIENEPVSLLVIRDLSERNEITRIKNEFVTMVSHELKTPLTSIKGALNIFNSSITSEMSEKAKNLLAIANNNSARLVNLINDILDIENIEAGKMRFQMEKSELSPLLESVVSLSETLCQKQGIKIEFNNKAKDAKVNVDKSRLIQVLNNLVSNAVKFTSRHSPIMISAVEEDSNVKISVQNYGENIPEKYHDHIFEKFSQLETSVNQKQGGPGLGLSISKAIIENMGGKIDFVSQNGTTEFFFVLPKAN